MQQTTHLLDHHSLLASAERMEPVSMTVAHVSAIVARSDHDIREVVEVLSLDQALTATLLRRANSVASGSMVEVKTVRDAVVRLGSSSLLATLMATSVSGRMAEAYPAYGLSEGALWRRSVAASVAADAVRAAARVPVPFETATAALLHDIGKVVISNHVGPGLVEVLAEASAHGYTDLVEAERSLFGVSHADVGGVVAQQWRLPYGIVEGILHHHRLDPDVPTISAAVSLGHAMVPEVIGSTADAAANPVPQPPFADSPTESACISHRDVMARLGIDPSRYVELLDGVRVRFSELAARYGTA